MPDPGKHVHPTLRQTLIDIARPAPNLEYRLNGWSDELDRQDELKNPKIDFSVQCEGSITIIHPKSQACMDWCAGHLPEDCPRWGAAGYAIETNYLPPIVAHLKRDGLLSEDEYVEACRNEADAQNQWAAHQDDQDFAEYQGEDR